MIKHSYGSVPTRSQVTTWTWSWPRLPVAVHLARFDAPSGVSELHATLRPTEYASVDAQLGWLEQAYQLALAEAGVTPEDALFRRFLCSDLPNQAASLRTRAFSDPSASDSACAVSWVGQPPAAPAKIALWAYHTTDPEGPLDKRRQGDTISLRRGELTHHWTTNLTCPEAKGSYDQTRAIFRRYEQFLGHKGMSLADNVLRTWLFVQNVDANYQGLVDARRELFLDRGLTAETHYIASTGIEGRAAEVHALVDMDAYAIGGVRPEQIQHLAALDYLSPTHLYGVTFERATAISFRDRRHTYISGTASIDNRGEILHLGQVERQLGRTLDNIQALLRQAGSTLDDMGVFIVYLRDPSDYQVIEAAMRERVGDAPMEVVVAPVCRPGWLVEIEGHAMSVIDAPELPAW